MSQSKLTLIFQRLVLELFPLAYCTPVYLRENIISEMKAVKFYSILCDKSVIIIIKGKFSFKICCIREEFLDFVTTNRE